MKPHWLNKERLSLYPRAMLAIYVVLGVAWFARSVGGVDSSGRPFGYDYVTFWAASRLALSHHAVAAYDLGSLMQVEHLAMHGVNASNPWYYPPTFFLLVLPLGLMPYLLSYGVFAAASAAAFIVAVRKTLAVPGMWLPLVAFSGIFMNLFSGQNGLLTAALIGFALLALRQRPVVAGVLIGLLTIKPHLGLLLPLALLCGRHWRALGSAVVTSVAFLALSMWVLGSDTLSAFLNSIPHVAQWVADDKLPLGKMPTFFSLCRLLGLPLQWAYVVQAAMAVSAAIAVGWVWLRCRDFELRAAALLVGAMLTPPYLFDYDLAWLALFIAWYTRLALRLGWLKWEREMLVLAWLLPLLTLPAYGLIRVQLAPFVLLALLLMVLRRVRAERARDSAGMDLQSISL